MVTFTFNLRPYIFSQWLMVSFSRVVHCFIVTRLAKFVIVEMTHFSKRNHGRNEAERRFQKFFLVVKQNIWQKKWHLTQIIQP